MYTEFTDVVLAKGCCVSMDGCGARRDKALVERVWRRAQCDGGYLKAYAGVSAVHADLIDYCRCYSAAPAYSSLDEVTPGLTLNCCPSSLEPHRMKPMGCPV